MSQDLTNKIKELIDDGSFKEVELVLDQDTELISIDRLGFALLEIGEESHHVLFVKNKRSRLFMIEIDGGNLIAKSHPSAGHVFHHQPISGYNNAYKQSNPPRKLTPLFDTDRYL